MSDDIIKNAVQGASGGDTPPFETVLAMRRPRRIRKLRAALIAVLVVGVVAAPFLLRPAPDETQIALLTPPTTDWLLETPDPQWVAQLDQNASEEPSHVH